MVKNIVYKLYKYIYFCVSINLKKFIKINIIYDYFLLCGILLIYVVGRVFIIRILNM